MAETAVEQAPAAQKAPEVQPSSSLQPPTQDFNQRASSAKSIADLKNLLSESLPTMQATVEKARRTPAESQKAEIPPDLKAAAEAEAKSKAEAETATETAEEAPAETVEEPAAETPAEPAATETDDDDDGDTPLEPFTGDRMRLRFGKEDKVGRLAATILKRNRDLTLEEAVGRARKELGIKDEREATPTQQPESQLPQTIEEVDARIKQLRADRKKANTDLKFEEVSDLNDQIEDLMFHRGEIQRQGDTKRAQEAAAYEREFDASVSQAADLYPNSTDPNSDFGKRMIEIERQLKANDDPLYSSPKKPMKIAQMVAAEMNIAPRRKGAPAPAKAAAPAPAAPAKKNVLPTGGSKTTVPVVPQKPVIDQRVENIKSLHDLRNLHKELGLGGLGVSIGR